MAIRQEEQKHFYHKLYNHLVLPPKLPYYQDSSIEKVESLLFETLLESITSLEKSVSFVEKFNYSDFITSIKASQFLKVKNRIDKAAVSEAVLNLGGSQFLFLHVASQNAGIFMHRQTQ